MPTAVTPPVPARAAARRRLVRMRHTSPVLTALAGLVAILVLVPIGVIVAEGVSAGWGFTSRMLFRPLVGTLLLHTVVLVAGATTAAALIGTAAAWCVERTDLPGRRWWGPLLAAPLAVPAFVSSYAWVSLSPRFEGFGGALLVVTLAYYPLVYLPVGAALRGMDPALEETGRSLGLGPVRTILRVVLPQLRPSLLGGMLLVALNVLTEFGAFALLRYSTFTTEIYAEYQTSFSQGGAAALSMALLACCIVLLVGEARLRGRRRYARVGRGSARRAARYPLHRLRPAALTGLGLLAMAGLGVPLGTLAYWLTQSSSQAVTVAGDSLSALASATASSIGLGLGGAGLTVLLALPVGLLSVRHRGRLATLIERSTYLTEALPGIVIALALVTVAIRFVHPLYQSALLLVIAYAILFLPLALVAVRGSLAQVPPTLTETARSLGCGPLGALRRVVLPIAAPGIGAGAALVFTMVVTELPTTLLLAPIGTQTLATQVWADTSSMAFAAAAPFAAVLVVLSGLGTWLLGRRFAGLRGHDAA